MIPLTAVWRALRPTQWVKNLLVAAAPLAAGSLLDGSVLLRTASAFVVFSAAASATYLINDCLDAEADRQHPVKQHRPIATGELAVPAAIALAAVLALGAAAGAAAISTGLLIALGVYLILTTAYSTVLKHVPVVDVVAVAAGFLVRALAGGAATDIPISRWFAVVVSAGALLLVVGKRVAELHHHGASTVRRRVLRWYSPTRLRAMAAVAIIAAIAGYLGWANDVADNPDRITIAVWASVLPFALAIGRYGWLGDRGEGESPDKLVRTDKVMLAAGALWALTYLAAVYG